MYINTNMAALNAWRSMTTNQTNLQKSLARLSSGYRINTAADDAAGLAVSEKMTAQTRGMSMAARNAQDAVSMVQTAEGGAGNIQDMLQRMRELSVQASSDTLQDTDRAQLQQEFSSLQSEIDRTAGSVQFNGRNLLDGTSGSKATITSGSSVTAQIGSNGLTSATPAAYLQVAVSQVAAEQTTTGGTANAGASTLAALNFSVGDTLKITLASDPTKTVSAVVTDTTQTMTTFVNNVNSQLTAAGMSAQVGWNGSNDLVVNSNVYGSTGNVTVAETIVGGGGESFGFGTGGTATGGTDANVTLKTGTDGVTFGTTLVKNTGYSVSDNAITGLVTIGGLNLTVGNSGTTVVKLSKSSLDFQVGANAGQQINDSFADLGTTNLGVDTLDISTKTGATSATSALDTALNTVSTERAKMGAMENRLDNAVSSLQTQNENITAAQSRIRDVDMAAEMANFTKYQVLSQASTSMLAQANQLSQGILTLLR